MQSTRALGAACSLCTTGVLLMAEPQTAYLEKLLSNTCHLQQPFSYLRFDNFLLFLQRFSSLFLFCLIAYHKSWLYKREERSLYQLSQLWEQELQTDKKKKKIIQRNELSQKKRKLDKSPHCGTYKSVIHVMHVVFNILFLKKKSGSQQNTRPLLQCNTSLLF